MEAYAALRTIVCRDNGKFRIESTSARRRRRLATCHRGNSRWHGFSHRRDRRHGVDGRRDALRPVIIERCLAHLRAGIAPGDRKHGAPLPHIRPPTCPTRARNQMDKALPGCQRSHIHASSTIPARNRRFPSFPIPCSRALPPLENGVPPSQHSHRERAIAKLSHKGFSHQKRGEVRTNRPQVCERTDHLFRFIGGRRLFQNGVTRRLYLFNQLQDEFEPIEQTFDTSARHSWTGSPSGWRREVSCSRRSRRKALKPFTPSVARMPSILLAIDRRSQVKSSRSDTPAALPRLLRSGLEPLNRPEARRAAKPSTSEVASRHQ